VGGVRVVLSAIWSESRSIVCVEVMRIMLDLLHESHLDFSNIALQP
jgi:hypothetical protein